MGPLPSSGMGRRSPSAHGLEVGAGAEGALGAGQDGHGGVRVGIEGEKGPAELVGADAVDRVAAFGTVDGDDGDGAIVFDPERARCGEGRQQTGAALVAGGAVAARRGLRSPSYSPTAVGSGPAMAPGRKTWSEGCRGGTGTSAGRKMTNRVDNSGNSR